MFWAARGVWALVIEPSHAVIQTAAIKRFSQLLLLDPFRFHERDCRSQGCRGDGNPQVRD